MEQTAKEEYEIGYIKSETNFLGVEFTLSDGSKQFVECKCNNALQAENCIRNCNHGEEPKQETLEQTAVEWLASQLNKKGFAQVVTDEEIKQANEIFEQQIKDAYQTSHISTMTADQYYTEKFK